MSEPRQKVSRACRFSFTAPVLYRRAGRRVWSDAVSVNMSRTGLLFATTRDVFQDGERVEFRVHLPNLEAARGCEVRCAGQVTRSMPGRFAGELGAMAVAIDDYLMSPLVDWPLPPGKATPLERGWKRR
jgi:hypothetical protein